MNTDTTIGVAAVIIAPVIKTTDATRKLTKKIKSHKETIALAVAGAAVVGSTATMVKRFAEKAPESE